MEKSAIKIYKLIGKLHTIITKASSFDDAIKDGLREILSNSGFDYGVIWYANDVNGATALSPFFWSCPLDLSSFNYGVGEGLVGKAYKTQTTVSVIDFKKEKDAKTESVFNGIEIASTICVPFCCNGSKLGCIQFIKSGDKPCSEEECDVCEMFVSMVELAIEETTLFVTPKTEKEIILSVKGLEKSYKSGDGFLQVLKGVNFDVFKGELLCLLGESGCGKSTVLNIIGGMDKADAGSVTFMGKDLIKAKEKELTEYRRYNTGFVFQSYNLMPNLTAKQNLELIGELVKDRLTAEEGLAMVGLTDKKDSYPSQLSGGQQQRVSIARALIKKPKIIFADEPTAALDYTTGIEVLSAIEKIIENGTTVVMVTHNEEIAKMANRVIKFRDGKTYEMTVNSHPLKATELVW